MPEKPAGETFEEAANRTDVLAREAKTAIQVQAEFARYFEMRETARKSLGSLRRTRLREKLLS